MKLEWLLTKRRNVDQLSFQAAGTAKDDLLLRRVMEMTFPRFPRTAAEEARRASVAEELKVRPEFKRALEILSRTPQASFERVLSDLLSPLAELVSSLYRKTSTPEYVQQSLSDVSRLIDLATEQDIEEALRWSMTKLWWAVEDAMGFYSDPSIHEGGVPHDFIDKVFQDTFNNANYRNMIVESSSNWLRNNPNALRVELYRFMDEMAASLATGVIPKVQEELRRLGVLKTGR